MFRSLKRLWLRMTGQGGRALVVDPNPDAVALLLAYLRKGSIRYDSVSSPEEAFAYLKEADEPPHAIIASYRQNGNTSGVEFARQLGLERATSRTPVLILHERMGEDAMAGLRKAVPRAEFIERPFSGADIRDRVRSAVRRGKRRPAAKTSIRNANLEPPPPRIRSRG